MGLFSGLHFGSFEPNAFFYSGNKSFYYGDGINTPFVTLDVVGHEFAHGITYFEAGLGNTGESGAINEGISDIWGAVLEWHVNAQKNIWLIGEDLENNHRSLSDPKSRLQPDTYGGQYWQYPSPVCDRFNDFCGVHINSGVINHWFFLTAEGGSGTNDNGSTYNVSGIGISKAASIVYHAQRFFLTPTSNYFTTRFAMISSAIILFGNNSCEERAVTNAWNAVGVGAAFSGTVVPQIEGPSEFCTGNRNYNVTQGSVSSWTLTPANGPASLSGTGNGRTLTRNYDANVTMTVNITNACNSGLTATSTKVVKLGFPPLSGTISGHNSASPNSINTFSVSLPSWATGTKQWIVPSGWSILEGQGTNSAGIRTGSSPGSIVFRMNACSTNRDMTKYVSISQNSFLEPEKNSIPLNNYFLISPNPARNVITLSFCDSLQREKAEINFYDQIGRIAKRIVTNPATYRDIDISDLANGIYYIQIHLNKTCLNSKLIIQR